MGALRACGAFQCICKQKKYKQNSGKKKMLFFWCLFLFGVVAPPVFWDANITSRIRTYNLCVLSSSKNKVLVQNAFEHINELSLFRLVLDSKRKQNNNHICFSPSYTRPGKTFILPNHISVTYILSTLPNNVLASVILHELLHTLGLADATLQSHESSVMALRVFQNPTTLEISEMTHSLYLSPSDVNALQLVYDMQIWAHKKITKKCYLSNPFLIAPALLQNISFPSRDITFRGCDTMLSEDEQLLQRVLEDINKLGFFQLFYQAKNNANKTICFSPKWMHRVYGFVSSFLPPNVKYTETLRTILVLLGFWPFANTTTEPSIMNFEIPEDFSEITFALWMSVADIKALSKLYYSQAWASAEPRKCE